MRVLRSISQTVSRAIRGSKSTTTTATKTAPATTAAKTSTPTATATTTATTTTSRTAKVATGFGTAGAAAAAVAAPFIVSDWPGLDELAGMHLSDIGDNLKEGLKNSAQVIFLVVVVVGLLWYILGRRSDAR